MYIITKNAAAWKDIANTQQNTQQNPREHRAALTTLWAHKPLKTPRGECVAVRGDEGRLQVAVRQQGRLQWVLADRVLQPGDLQRWLRQGATRQTPHPSVRAA